jgi:tetratricopeptide (TPR) repeat protein
LKNLITLQIQEEIKIPESKISGFLSKRDALLNKADALVLEADQLSYEGRYEEAVARYDQAISIFPSNPEIWAFKAITLSGGLNRHDEAMQCWDRAKKLDNVLADAITYTNTEKFAVNENELKDCSSNIADRIRNLVKQQSSK